MSSSDVVIVKDLGSFIDSDAVRQFQIDGFLLHPESIFSDNDNATLHALHHALEAVVNGRYDTGAAPSSSNALPADLLREGQLSFADVGSPVPAGGKSRSTIHLINAWRANRHLRALVCSPALGTAVRRLMGWEREGCRLAQDQVWIKPPSSGALSFHRDTPYFDFSPKEVCTVWIPFDDVNAANVGALEYCCGSHHWAGGRRGSARQFFKPNYTALLHIAARDEANARSDAAATDTVSALPEVRVVRTRGCGGCCSFHNGNTWHGSGPNETGGWRRGIGIHFIRGDATLSEDCGRLWQPFRHPDGSNTLLDEFFPLVAPPLSR